MICRVNFFYSFNEKIISYSISDFKTASETLRVNDLRQALL